MGIVATRMTEIRAALALGRGALLKWGPFRAWIGPRLKPSGKCRIKVLPDWFQELENRGNYSINGTYFIRKSE